MYIFILLLLQYSPCPRKKIPFLDWGIVYTKGPLPVRTKAGLMDDNPAGLTFRELTTFVAVNVFLLKQHLY